MTSTFFILFYFFFFEASLHHDDIQHILPQTLIQMRKDSMEVITLQFSM